MNIVIVGLVGAISALLIYASPLKKLTLKSWLLIFVFADLLDSLSTFFCAYLYEGYNTGPYVETNQLINLLADYMGLDLAIVLHTSISILLACASYKILVSVTSNDLLVGRALSLLWRTFLFLLSADAFYTVMRNLTLPYIDLPVF